MGDRGVEGGPPYILENSLYKTEYKSSLAPYAQMGEIQPCGI